MAIFNNVICESTKYVTICIRVLIRSAIGCNMGASPIPGKQQRAAFIRDFKGPIWHFGIALWADSPQTLSLCRGFFGRREMSSRSPHPRRLRRSWRRLVDVCQAYDPAEIKAKVKRLAGGKRRDAPIG